MGLPGTFLKIKETTATPVMRYRLPLLAEDVSHNRWVGWGAPPPGSQTAGTAAAFNKFGKGQSFYLGARLFWALQFRAEWIQRWVPALIRQLAPHPSAELRSQPFSEYVHGTFFVDEEKRLILVQMLDAVQLATKGEPRATPNIEITLDADRMRIDAARVVWPAIRDLTIRREGHRTHILIEKPASYSALLLQLA